MLGLVQNHETAHSPEKIPQENFSEVQTIPQPRGFEPLTFMISVGCAPDYATQVRTIYITVETALAWNDLVCS